MSCPIVFTTTDKKTPTLVYDEAYPSSHRAYFMKTPDNRVFAESRYRGDGVFAGKSYFELLGELNLPPKSNITDIAAFGRAIVAGTTKIIRKTRDNNIEMREIIYPGIYEDDELIWRNRKPEICCQCVYPETQGATVECECDFCLAFQGNRFAHPLEPLQGELRSPLTPPLMRSQLKYGIKRERRVPFSMGFKGNDEFPLTSSL